MANNRTRIVLDTNIIVSAFLFGGIPEKILRLVEDESIVTVIISPILKAELFEVLTQKFHLNEVRINEINEYISEYFEMVNPRLSIEILKDDDDNRVLEAAVEGGCSYIITGDKELLDLSFFKNIKIIPPGLFSSKIPAADVPDILKN